jgi:hypothetical protein
MKIIRNMKEKIGVEMENILTRNFIFGKERDSSAIR